MKHVWIALLMFASTAQAQTVLSVGNDAACDFDSLADALDSVPSNALDGDYLIEVADTLITEPVVVNKSVEITGGLLICGGNPVPGRRLEIDADHFSPGAFGAGLSIAAVNTNKVVRLNNIDIKNHESSLGGGILVQTVLPEADVELYLKSVSLLGNTTINAGIGGGLLMMGPGTKKLVLQSVFIHNNRASRGAGIFCENNGEIKFLSGEVSGNVAEYFSSSPSVQNPDSARGGGFYLENCDLETAPDPDQFNAPRLVQDNEAFRDLDAYPFEPGFSNYGGAGLFVVDSDIDMPFNAPLSIEDNRAYMVGDEHGIWDFKFERTVGGGIYATRTNISTKSMRLVGNSARRGGGMFLVDSSLALDGNISSSVTCGYDSQEACVLIENNEAFGFREVEGPFCTHHAGSGGAIYATRTDLEIDSVLFRDNKAGFDGDSCALGFDLNDGKVRGSALFVNEGNALLANNIFFRNGGYGANDVIGIGPGSEFEDAEMDFRMYNSTIAEHELSGSDDANDRGFISHQPIGFERSGYHSFNLVIEGSLFSDNNSTLDLLSEKARQLLDFSGTASSALRCNVVDDPADLTQLDTLLQTENLIAGGQDMVDPANGNFQLDTAGTGVDFCDFTILTSETVLDARNRQRPRDVAGVDNGGLVDVGAFEADGVAVPFFDVEPLFTIVAPDSDSNPHYEEVTAGTPVTMEVKLTNNGLSNAPINSGFRYIMRGIDPGSVDVDASVEFACSTMPFEEYSLEIKCENFLSPILPGGTTGAVTITAIADGTPGITFSYLQAVDVTFLGGTTDAIPGNNFFTATLGVTGSMPTADMSVINEDLVDPVSPGEAISYQVTVVNNGTAIATDVILADDLPDEVTFLNESSVGFDCEHNAGTVMCVIPSMPPGSSRMVQINVLSPETQGDVVNMASVGANEPDPNPGNNTEAETTSVMVDEDVMFKSGFE